MYIDTHCHLDNNCYYDNLDSIIDNSFRLGVNKIIIPGADISTLDRAISISEKYNNIYFSVGIHPLDISFFNLETKNKMIDAISNPRCVAIGEIGLDYHLQEFCDSDKMQQELGFREQIELSILYDLPIIIHTRDSNPDTIRILKEYEQDIKGLVFHCFGGDRLLIDSLSCPTYYGIGGVVTFKNASNLRECIKDLPLDSIILETDAPYLAPTPHRGKTNTPEYIPIIASYLSEYLDIGIDVIASKTTENAVRLFSF